MRMLFDAVRAGIAAPRIHFPQQLAGGKSRFIGICKADA
jgi:hypothetical protein